MSTRSSDQQKKQRQKEFKEKKEHQKLLKAMATKAKRELADNGDKMAQVPKIED